MSARLLRRDGVWWGWGRDHDRPALGPGARAMLEAEIGPAEPAERVPLSSVHLPAAGRVPAAVVAAAGGEGAVSTELEDRVRHAAGKSYPDLVRIRSGVPGGAPDAVLAPGSAEAVAATLAACAAERVAVVPFGGGTSVVGGVEPVRDGFDLLVSLDLAGLRACTVDPRSQTATLGAGLRGVEAETLLNDAGFTLGHFPQSWAYATIGGFAATRSAGQASSGYGRFDSLVTSVRMQTPRGPIATVEAPHSAAGPALRELLIGSEGTLGVITDVTVRVRTAPEARRYEGWVVPSFGDGIETVRALAQRDVLPDVLRLSDRDETRVSLALSGLEGARRKALDAYLGLRGRGDGCIVIVGWEGEREAVARRRELGAALLRAGGAVPLGRRPGDAWERGRYEGPYLRDALMDAGVLTETLETSHLYGRIEGLYGAVRGALADAMAAAGTPGIVLCHVSHVYRDGASLYFTFLCARRPGEEIAQWQAIKGAACEAIVRAGGTITHHHGVGRDHAPYMEAEVGGLGLESLRAVKERLDPVGVMNPGKLLGD
jgi:alkyldihydroxyacetonephosphate synthase